VLGQTPIVQLLSLISTNHHAYHPGFVRCKQEGSPFEGVSYDLTKNDILGLPGSSQPGLIVLSPFPTIPKEHADGKLESFDSKPGQMPTEQAFKDVLREGIKLSAGQDTLFIDLADLDTDNTELFTEGGNNSVAQAIADQLNSDELKNVKLVIRWVRGTFEGSVGEKFWTA
jgi:hypothetical protein